MLELIYYKNNSLMKVSVITNANYRADDPDTPIMSKEAVYVRMLGDRYLLDALVIHIYKNVLYQKFLLIKKKRLCCFTVSIPWLNSR